MGRRGISKVPAGPHEPDRSEANFVLTYEACYQIILSYD